MGRYLERYLGLAIMSVPSFEQGAYGKRNKFYEKGYDYDAADNSTGEDQLCA